MSAPLEAFLRSQQGIPHLLEHSRLISSLQAIFAEIAPPQIAQYARVSNVRGGKVIIVTESGAIANKLRQFSTSLQEAFGKMGENSSGIEFKVQPFYETLSAVPTEEEDDTTRQGSAVASQRLEELHHQLPQDSPLAQAVRRLAKTLQAGNDTEEKLLRS